MKCCRKKCEKCEKYNDKFRQYKKEILRKETRNDELHDLIYKLLETQKQILQYIESQKVVGVNPEKKTS